uniref:Uncharacterized protein n=1 Tax=Noccaea caerulescens TaxID=107243 RepID=A0A1J3DXL1_NOCCA
MCQKQSTQCFGRPCQAQASPLFPALFGCRCGQRIQRITNEVKLNNGPDSRISGNNVSGGCCSFVPPAHTVRAREYVNGVTRPFQLKSLGVTMGPHA